nr:uncharacterized protein LOC128705613 [Cherax quadricarinatus]
MLSECMGSFESSVRVMVVGDFNAKVGKNVMEGVVGKFGVPGVNVNGEPLIELCVERNLVISNTYFMKKRINKYTRYDVAHNESSLLDYVLVDKRLMGRLQDVHVYRGATDILDHYLVVATVRVRGRWEKRKVATTSKREVKVYKLREEEVRARYKRVLAERWASAKMSSGGVEEGWNSFKNAVLECGAEVCGYRRVRAGGKRSDWWNDEVKGVIKEKKVAYERFLQSRSVIRRAEYMESKRKVKRVVRECKRRADERVGEALSRNFNENKKKFWSELNKLRKPRESMDLSVKNRVGELVDGEREEEREAVISCTGQGGIPSFRSEEEQNVSVGEVCEALRRMKGGKAAGTDGIMTEMLKAGGDIVLEWLVLLFNKCMKEGKVPRDWRGACIVPLYKGKGDKRDCKNYRGISLLGLSHRVSGSGNGNRNLVLYFYFYLRFPAAQ